MGRFTSNYVKSFLKTAQVSDIEQNFFNSLTHLNLINEQNNDDKNTGILDRTWTFQGIVYIPRNLLINGDISDLFNRELSDPMVTNHIPAVDDFLSGFNTGYDNIHVKGELSSINKDSSHEDAWNVTIKVNAHVELDTGSLYD